MAIITIILMHHNIWYFSSRCGFS